MFVVIVIFVFYWYVWELLFHLILRNNPQTLPLRCWDLNCPCARKVTLLILNVSVSRIVRVHQGLSHILSPKTCLQIITLPKHKNLRSFWTPAQSSVHFVFVLAWVERLLPFYVCGRWRGCRYPIDQSTINFECLIITYLTHQGTSLNLTLACDIPTKSPIEWTWFC